MDKRAVDRGMRAIEQGKSAVKEPGSDQPRGRVGRAIPVKNKAPAPVQITAEQLLREAHDFKEQVIVPPTQKIGSEEELDDYRLRKRKEFEDVVRRSRHSLGVWVKYAKWEASQKEFARARSVWERALDVDPRNASLWLKYVEMEMKNRFINHARNLWDRVVARLPRVDQFWYKFAHMEEMLGNVANARQVFERWMQWEPDHQAWQSFIKLEIRHKQYDRARQVYERYIRIHHEVDTYLKFAKFEQRYGTRESARAIYERAVQELGEDANDEALLLPFAKFEEENKEFERARAIYRYALDNIPKHRAEALYQTYTQFEKQHGDRHAVEDVVLSRRRFQYEEELKESAHNYDVWFDYIRLEEGRGEQAKIREVFERAIGNVPPIAEKRMWERYIYLWINFALYEEVTAKDLERTRQVYTKCLEIIPHKQFTFSRIWIMAANFEVRCKNLDAARKILGTAIGLCPREKVFKAYIDLEHKLGFVDRCRKLYEKYLEFMPENCAAWSKFAELEASLDETDRARAIFELAIKQPQLDMPELLWKAYIDFEIKGQRYDKVRALYARLLERTKHVKVWISRAQFEASVRDVNRARAVFEDADKFFKGQDTRKEERVMLLESWLDFEKSFGDGDSLKGVANKLPRRIKKRRELKAEDGSHLGYEEYYDYIFPDEANKASNLKLLEMARKWKKQKTGADGEAAE